MEWQIFQSKPWYKKFFYINWQIDENYGYEWYDYVAAIGPLQIRWRGNLRKL